MIARTTRSTPWVATDGSKPDLPGYAFVYACYAGETREEAETFRNGYGQSVDETEWHKVIEYRLKHAGLAK